MESLTPQQIARLSESEFIELQRHFRAMFPPTFARFFRDTVSFEPHEWQLKHLCPLMERLVSEKGIRILVHGPPQYGKSIVLSKRFPAWALGINPLLRIVLACHNVTHAEEFVEVVRDIMHGSDYAEKFPSVDSSIPLQASTRGFKTRARVRLNDSQDSLTPVGLLSGFMGKGGDILLIDDPYNSPDDARSENINDRVWRWWTELAKVRVDKEEANVVVMFHRYHEDDFAGRLLAEGGWEYMRFPAVADENENQDDPTGREVGEMLSPLRSRLFLQEIEDSDPQTWLGMFQGRPRKPEGEFIKREDLKKIAAAQLPRLDLWVRFWDLATKDDQTGDFVAGALIGVGPDHMLYLRDMVRFRAEWPDACGIIADVTERDFAVCQTAKAQYAVGVEKVAWMRAMVQDLFLQPVFKPVQLWPCPPDGDKKERASGWVARARHDKFRMVTGPWNEEFIKECLAFDGKGLTHDDQVDSVSGAYGLIWSLRGHLIENKNQPQVGSPAWYQREAELNQPRSINSDRWDD